MLDTATHDAGAASDAAAERFERLAVAAIRCRDGSNPRTHFFEESIRELSASIATQGVIQPLLVRPDPDHAGSYLLVAGERRLRASIIAGLSDVPAYVRDMDDREALAAAASENVQREAMSPGDEAQVARDLLDLHDGDRDEVMRRLGWSAKRLDARLALLHATERVRGALAAGEIKLGHAELLATLPASTQDGTVADVIAKGVSVGQLREVIKGFARPLSEARFDTSVDCTGCPHNSATQANLFSESIGAGKCSNRECWQAKTDEALAAVKARAREQYASVYLDTEKRSDSYTSVLQRDVGRDQLATGCQGCAYFGALIDTRPGQEGEIHEDVCFNLPCHREKVEAFKAAQQPAATGDGSAGANATAGGGTKQASTGKGAAQGKSKGTAAALPKAVVAAHDRFIRDTAAEVAREDTRMTKALAVYALYLDVRPAQDTVSLPDGGSITLGASFKRRESIERLAALNEASLDALMARFAGDKLAAPESAPIEGEAEVTGAAEAIMRATSTEVAGRFTIDADYLKSYRKAGIEALMRECGFADWYDAQHPQAKGSAFKKLMGQKTADLVQAIVTSEFDFSQVVPEALAKRLRPESGQRDCAEQTKETIDVQ